MGKHWDNLKYVMRHKKLVYKAGRQLGVGRLQLLIHDWSKFSPSEFGPYSDNFFSDTPQPRYEFEAAWLHHCQSNKHHWQYWILIQNYGEIKPLEIPEKYVREMVADWTAMGWARERYSAIPWYDDNRDKMILHPTTRTLVEDLLDPWRKVKEERSEGNL